MNNSKTFTLPAFAKINRFLRVLGKRGDGFHEICTAFQTVSLCDQLTFSTHDDLVLTCDDAEIPTDESNLILKAAARLKSKYSVRQGAAIHLAKRIPSPGGLGGGSSDCAVALLGLAKLWSLRLSMTEFFRIGEELGSDVPFFFHGGIAGGIGRGTEIVNVAEREEKYMILVAPRIGVSTGLAYAKLNSPRLTKMSPKSILKLCCEEAEKLDSKQYAPINDFETVVFGIEPELKRIKETLLTCGAGSALMSGSGATIFGIFENEETRQATLKALEKESSWRKFAVATVSRADYREALKSVFEVVSD